MDAQKGTLSVSITLNLVLLAVLGGSWIAPNKERSLPRPVQNTLTSQVLQERHFNPRPARFSWREIESTNYPSYIANLRAIDCPEETIRDIIVAEIESIYVPKREQVRLEERRSGVRSDSRLQALRLEESNLIAYLLGTGAGGGSRADNSQNIERSAGGTESSAVAKWNPQMPLAFLDFDTNSIVLDERQFALLERLRQGFTAKLGNDSADISSPEYAEDWRRAQLEYDESLQVLLGEDNFLEFERQAQGRYRAGL